MDKKSDKKNLEQQKKRDKRYDKCKYCYWMWSDSFCIKKKFGFLDKKCFRRLFK